MSVRPFTMWGKKNKHGLPAPMVDKVVGGAKAGATPSRSDGSGRHAVPCEHRIDGRHGLFGEGQRSTASLPRDKSCQEVARIKDIKGDLVTFFKPLKHNHPANDLVIAGVRAVSVVGGCGYGDGILA